MMVHGDESIPLFTCYVGYTWIIHEYMELEIEPQ